MREQGVKIDDATRDALKADIKSGKWSRAALARKHDVSTPTVSRWASQLGIKLPSGHADRKRKPAPGAIVDDKSAALLEDLKALCRTLIKAIDQPVADGPRRSRAIAMAAIAVRKFVDDGSLGPLRQPQEPTGTDALVARAKEIHGEGDSLLTVLYEHVTFLSMEVRRLETTLKKRERLAAPSPRS